jgi:putative aldouronate transport system substrate-binding protein
MVKGVAALASLALVGGMAACGGGEAATDKDGKPIVTILVVKNANQAKMSEMTWAKELAKDAGVSITWKEVSDDQWGSRRTHP